MNKQDTFKKLLASTDDKVYVRFLLETYVSVEIKEEILTKYNEWVDECNEDSDDILLI